MLKWFWLVPVFAMACETGYTKERVARAAMDTHMMRLEAPIKTWDEAIPLGNGIMGGLLWGSGNAINLSLDRGDLWDERLPKVFGEPGWGFNDIKALVAAGNQREIVRKYDQPYREPAPTKLPGGRLVLALDESRQARVFTLDMRKAVGSVDLGSGTLECFFCATERVAMIRVGDPAVAHKFLRPAGLDKLGYKPAVFGESNGMSWMVQEAALGLTYAVVVASKKVGKGTELAVAVTTNTTGDDPLGIATERVSKALAAGYDAMLIPHRKWWDRFWAISSVDVPNERIQRHYNLVKYFYGAASRPDAPPIPLQGVWTRDDGGLPPWKGDFHHDLNTQMTYLPYHTAGLFDSGMSFINLNWDLLPAYRKFARDFFGVDGAAMASVATLAGKPTGGWPQYSFTAPNALWVGQSFYLHWRHTMDRTFLRERAYPWLSEITTGIVNLLEEKDGRLYLPLSSSPEIFNNALQAWLPPNSNYDLALMQWAFDALAEMADALENADEAKRWRALRARLEPLHVDKDGVLMFDRRHAFDQSHRHHSHSMAIHPLGILNIDGSDRDRHVIHATLDRMIAKGTRAWTGYSFSWFASVLARAGRGEAAARYLVDYERAFILRNGFHVNGDQLGAGLSAHRYRPFTLEGNFLAMEAVHDMVLQSWAPNPSGDPTPLVRIFPAMPWIWHDASFEDLSAEGGFLVSARRENNATTGFRIRSPQAATLRIKDNFGGRDIRFKGPPVSRKNGLYEAGMTAGGVLEGALATPGSIPPPPENAFTMPKPPPVIVRNTLPLRLGADSNGQNRFVGDMARASIFDRALRAAEIAALAEQAGAAPETIEGCVASWAFDRGQDGVFAARGSKPLVATQVGELAVVDTGTPLGKALRMDGEGYLSVPHDAALDCADGTTLEAWVCPGYLPKMGARIIDKSPAGLATGYLLDTYPGNSVRLIVRDPHVIHKANLAAGKWVHIAATVDGKTARAALYVDGRKVR